MGYHPGFEDDCVYLAAVKHDLHPSLFPFDAPFFETQLQATVFDKVIAGFVHLTQMPVAWTELLWQLGSILLIVWSALLIVRRIFDSEAAHWAAIGLLTAMFTLPVSGTALYIADQHLHPRNLATGLILLAISRLLANQRWASLFLLVVAFILHPIMGAMGISFCCFLLLAQTNWAALKLGLVQSSELRPKALAAVVPLGWMFEPPTPTWRQAINTRTYYFLFRWKWYEWLGAIGPLVLFWILTKVSQKRGDLKMARFAFALLAFGVFQQIIAIVITGPGALIRLVPLQPMRYLHLVYIFMVLIGGGFIGQFILQTRWWRWAVFLLIVNFGMFISQREVLAGSPHLELPGLRSDNSWIQAFDWVRENTPQNAYFALDPQYMAKPGENFHSFRALAERSVLSDALKDTAVTTQVPELAVIWKQQQIAQAGFSQFQLKDFQRLKAQYGVDWVLVALPAASGLSCKWHNDLLAACQIP